MTTRLRLSAFRRVALLGMHLIDKEKPKKFTERRAAVTEAIKLAHQTTSDFDKIHYVSRAYSLIMVGGPDEEHIENLPFSSNGFASYLMALHHIATTKELNDALKAVYREGAHRSLDEKLGQFLSSVGRGFSPKVIKILRGENGREVPDYRIMSFIIDNSKEHVEKELANQIRQFPEGTFPRIGLDDI